LNTSKDASFSGKFQIGDSHGFCRIAEERPESAGISSDGAFAAASGKGEEMEGNANIVSAFYETINP